MKRLKITIQYDGTEFHGWQLQDDKRTVQGVIEETLKNVFNHNKRISLYAAGRTDTGVHSIGQVAHFDFNSKLDDDIIMRLIILIVLFMIQSGKELTNLFVFLF